MNIDRMKDLAGIPVHEETKLYRTLTEVVELPDNISMDELATRLDHCKKALSLANKLPDPADKKRWLSACFVNLNKVRASLQRMIAAIDAPIAPIKTKEPAPQALKGTVDVSRGDLGQF